jgi:hypothetical protein
MFNLKITKMKKLFSLLCLVVLLGVSVNVMGQGTGIAPTLGSTHTYKINGGVAVSGNSYTWSLDKGSLGTSAAATDYSFGATTNAPSIDITWLATASLSTEYYLRVVERTTASGCSNEKVIQIVPVNPFFLVISTTQTSPVCYASDVAVTLLTGVPQYNHGTVDLIYTVTPNNIGSGTSYSFVVADVLSNDANFSALPVVTGGNLASGTVTSTGTGAVTLTYTVTNDVFFTNATDPAGTAADINLEVTISAGKTNQNVADNTTGTYVVTVEANRPDTGAITTD